MNPQRTLFDPGPANSTPYQAHSPNSKAAAERVSPTLGRRQAEVLEYIAAHPEGVTDNAIIGAMVARGYSANGPRARRVELTRRGLIIPCGVQDGSTLWRVVDLLEG
jgi:hypothetical protein